MTRCQNPESAGLTKKRLPRKFLIGTVVAAILVASWAARAEDTTSGNYFLEACRAAANNLSAAKDPFKSGVCVGQIEALSQAASSLTQDFVHSCIPNTVTRQQMAKVVVAYMDSHPAFLHEPLGVLILLAFASAWPCKNSN